MAWQLGARQPWHVLKRHPSAILWLGASVPQLPRSHEKVGGGGHRLAQDGEELACRVVRVGGERKRVRW